MDATKALEALKRSRHYYEEGHSAVEMALCIDEAIAALSTSAAADAPEPAALTDEQISLARAANPYHFPADRDQWFAGFDGTTSFTGDGKILFEGRTARATLAASQPAPVEPTDEQISDAMESAFSASGDWPEDDQMKQALRIAEAAGRLAAALNRCVTEDDVRRIIREELVAHRLVQLRSHHD